MIKIIWTRNFREMQRVIGSQNSLLAEKNNRINELLIDNTNNENKIKTLYKEIDDLNVIIQKREKRLEEIIREEEELSKSLRSAQNEVSRKKGLLIEKTKHVGNLIKDLDQVVSENNSVKVKLENLTKNIAEAIRLLNMNRGGRVSKKTAEAKHLLEEIIKK